MCNRASADGGKGAAIMESIPRKPLRAVCHCSLVLLGLTYLLGTADARPMLLPSERFPGPWLEVTQEVRDVLTAKQDCCLQSGRGTRIVEQSRRISSVLHIGREALDKLARTTRGAHRSRPGQALPGYRTARRILRLVQAELPREERRLTSRRDFRKASPNKAGCVGARSGIHCPDCVAAS